MTLTILIPTIDGRENFLERLKMVLSHQSAPFADRVIVRVGKDAGLKNGGAEIGKKRNELIDSVQTEYAVFIDDDDTVASDYVKKVMEGIEKNVDVVGFRGIITNEGGVNKEFIHKLGLKWTEDNRKGIYYRPPNHLNPMKVEFFRAIRFPEISHGEDFDFSNKLAEAGLLKSEHFIDDYMYFYQYRNKK